MNKDNLTEFTKECFNSLDNIQLVKFKGRKTINHIISDSFNPDDYVMLFKEGDHYYSIVIKDKKLYKLIYDSTFTIQPLISNFEETELNQNETFSVESIERQ